MQLTSTFSTLLTSLLLAVAVQDVAALPADNSAGMVTLPLKRLENQRRDLHPTIVHQQQINRAHRRYARMTGREEPSADELGANLHRRMYLLSSGPGSRVQSQKRYNRQGVHRPNKSQDLAAGGAEAEIAALEAALTGGSAGAQQQGGQGGQGQAAPQTGLTQANPPADKNSLGLDIEGDDTGYVATIQIGTPPKNFNILMDSGSADLWVGSEQCQSEDGGDCGKHNFLGPQSSSSFKDSNSQFQVTYGSGEVAGTLCQDNVNIAGLNLKAHTFGTADVESVQFSADTTAFDGLMGLAKSTLSQQKQPTPVEALASTGLIKQAITSYKISRLADNKNDGEITFGGLDSSKFDSATLETFDNISPTGFWEGDMPAVTVDGKDTGLQGRTAILDTGTTLIIAPPKDAAQVHAAIPGAKSDGQGGFTVPCQTKANVALTFGKTSFAIDPRDIATQPVDPNDPNGDCLSGISSGQVGGATEWLVGDVFLKNAYFSTDVTKNTISLAKLK